jgi:hypothetical protein
MATGKASPDRDKLSPLRDMRSALPPKARKDAAVRGLLEPI